MLASSTPRLERLGGEVWRWVSGTETPTRVFVQNGNEKIFSITSSGTGSWAFGVMVFEMQNAPHWRVVPCNSSSARAPPACLRCAAINHALWKGSGWLSAEEEGNDANTSHFNPHRSLHCSKQDDLQTSNANEEDGSYARSGAMPGNRCRRKQ